MGLFRNFAGPALLAGLTFVAATANAQEQAPTPLKEVPSAPHAAPEP
ncbi:hypothetical protein [Erythrobacter oryzae]|nr:hypothetical protein [Erythrobacter sp. COR-2]